MQMSIQPSSWPWEKSAFLGNQDFFIAGHHIDNENARKPEAAFGRFVYCQTWPLHVQRNGEIRGPGRLTT